MPPRVELGYGAGAVPETAEPGSGPAHAALPGEGVIEVEGVCVRARLLVVV